MNKSLVKGKILNKDAYFNETNYHPHAGQRQVHMDSHRHKVLCNGRRWGKHLDINTPIPTPSGWTTMGELVEGDLVYGADGQSYPVVEVFPVTELEDCYEIEFDDGNIIIASGSHLWETYDQPARRALRSTSRHTPPKVRTTEEILATLHRSSKSVQHPNHSVRVTKPLSGVTCKLPIDPYLLGRWLGDGSSHHGTIGSLQADAKPIIERGGQVSKVQQNDYMTWRVPGLASKLRQAGLRLNKHIPTPYLRASIEVREALLAGLIDSYGSCERGRVRFSNSDQALFDQVVELVVSLGYKVKVSSRMGKLNGVEKQRSWRFTFYPDRPCAELERKQAHLTARTLPVKHSMHYITAIRRVGNVPVRCISVDSPGRLYLAGLNMVPTHNTLLGAKEAEPRAFVLNRLGQAQHGWLIGPEFKDCEKEFRVVHDTFKELGIDKVSTKFLNNVDNGNMVIKTKWGFWLECRSALHPETLVGEGLDFVVMCEAGRQKRKTWTEYIRPALSDKRGWSLHTGVPEGSTATSLLYSLFQRGQAPTTAKGAPNPWRSWRMPSWTNTVMFPGGRNDPEILDAEEDLTEDEFNRQYGAIFSDRVGRVLQEWDEDVHVKDIAYDVNLPVYAALDFGYTNWWVLLWIQVDPFDNVYIIRERRWKMKDTVEIANETLDHPIDGGLIRKMSAFYPDPADPDAAQVLQRMWKKPSRGDTGGTINDRVALIRRHLKIQNQHLEEGHVDRKPKLFIDRSCTQLIWEIQEGWRWPAHKSETKSDSEIPMDKDNHGPEALGRFFKGYMTKRPSSKANSARQRKAKIGRNGRMGGNLTTSRSVA